MNNSVQDSNNSSISVTSTQLPLINFGAGGRNTAKTKHQSRQREPSMYEKEFAFADTFTKGEKQANMLDISRYDFACARDSRIYLLKLLKPTAEDRAYI